MNCRCAVVKKKKHVEASGVPNVPLRTILYIRNLTRHWVAALSKCIKRLSPKRWQLSFSFERKRERAPGMQKVVISEEGMNRFDTNRGIQTSGNLSTLL